MNPSIRTPIPVIDLDRWTDIAESARTALVPLVIRGACAALARRWTPARFAEQWPDMEVDFVADLPEHGVPYRERGSARSATAALSVFVQRLDAGERCYLNQAAVARFPELERELDLRPLRLSRLYATNVWVGGRTRSGLHYDHADNLFLQVYGRKRAVLARPQDAGRLYPFPDNPSKSQVDPEKPDLEAYPSFAHCRCWTADLAPGDGLYIPRGWWHFIATDDVSISINCWHGDSLTEAERLRMFLAGGPRVIWRTAADFIWHGVMQRPHEGRMFSPTSPGIAAYLRLRRRFGRTSS